MTPEFVAFVGYLSMLVMLPCLAGALFHIGTRPETVIRSFPLALSGGLLLCWMLLLCVVPQLLISNL